MQFQKHHLLAVAMICLFAACVGPSPKIASTPTPAPVPPIAVLNPVKESELWLQRNLLNKDVKKTISGLQYKVLRTTQNCFPDPTVPVIVHYKGWLTNGFVFDNSYARGEPGRYPLDQMIAGWTEGIPMMRQGEMWEFYIPPGLAYGDRGSPPVIKPDDVMIFQIELVKAERCKKE